MRRVELIYTSIIEILLNYFDKFEKTKMDNNCANLPIVVLFWKFLSKASSKIKLAVMLKRKTTTV